jgi:hypothetical protein
MTRYWLLLILFVLNIAANALFWCWLSKPHRVEPWLSADALSLGQTVFGACFMALWRLPFGVRGGLAVLLAFGLQTSSLLAWEAPFDGLRCLAAGWVAAAGLRVAGLSVSDSDTSQAKQPWQFHLTTLFWAMAWLAIGVVIFANQRPLDPDYLIQVRHRLLVEIVAVYVLVIAPLCLAGTLRDDPRSWHWFGMLTALVGLGVPFAGFFAWRLTGRWNWELAWGVFEGADYWRVHAQILCPLLINLLVMQGLGWRLRFR